MKYLLYFLISAQLLANGCKKHTNPIINPVDDPIDTIKPPVNSHIIDFGKISLLKNGIKWQTSSNGWFDHSDSSFVINIKQGFGNGVRETFRIGDIPKFKGTYSFEYFPSPATLHNNQIPEPNFAMVYDGDQPIGDFVLDTLRHDHFIEVLHYDTLNNTAEGRFQIFLKRDPSINGFPFPGVPDSIAITEGKFYLPVKKY